MVSPVLTEYQFGYLLLPRPLDINEPIESPVNLKFISKKGNTKFDRCEET